MPRAWLLGRETRFPVDGEELVSDERAEAIKVAWRTANPHIVQLWYDLNDCALEAVSRAAIVGLGHHGIEFRCDKRVLSMRLPSGRSVVYRNPSIKQVDTPWGDKRWAVCYFAVDNLTRKWAEFTGYSGIWTENLVQAAARDIMADALVRLHAENLNPVLTVHDEAVCELPQTRFPTAQDAAGAVKRVMQTAPAWAKGLPIAVDTSADARYTKV